ncbi:MAG: HD domain-containing protein [Oceanococcaceae bacterium]
MRISEIANMPGEGMPFTASIVETRAGQWTEGWLQAPVVRVEDCSGRAGLLLPRMLEHRLPELVSGAVIAGTADFVHYGWGLGGWLRQWQVMEACTVPNIMAVQPVSRCPDGARAALLDLSNAIDALQTAAVRDAVNGMLMTVLPELLTAGASYQYHHAGAGGLLEHTVETALLARDEARECFPAEPWRVDTVFLLALMHDIAKAHVQRADAGNPVIKSAHHEIGSMALAAPVLMRLGDAHPQAGRLAGTVLRWMLKGKLYMPDFACPEGEIIRMADQTSVRRDRCRRPALVSANDDHFAIAVNNA